MRYEVVCGAVEIGGRLRYQGYMLDTAEFNLESRHFPKQPPANPEEHEATLTEIQSLLETGHIKIVK